VEASRRVLEGDGREDGEDGVERAAWHDMSHVCVDDNGEYDEMGSDEMR